MALDLAILASKLARYRNQFQAKLEDVASATGISIDRLENYESGLHEPSGDEILIIADYYKCDYKFFISNDVIAPFEQTATLFRKHGDSLSSRDRWTVQEFLFLCECEELLLQILTPIARTPFSYKKRGTHHKTHGKDAAAALRRHLGYNDTQVRVDVFDDFRAVGIHVFRRELANSNISGLFVRHPFAGPCLLVNYSEDIYRQRFTAAHEAAHAILDDGSDINISFSQWDKKDLSEIRANTFASHFLMPPSILRAIPEPGTWTLEKSLDWANRLKVSTAALSFALREASLVDEATAMSIRQVSVPFDAKSDPELSATLSSNSRERKANFLKRGLSGFYVDLCFRAYRQNEISAGRLAEMLFVPSADLHVVATDFAESIDHGD